MVNFIIRKLHQDFRLCNSIIDMYMYTLHYYRYTLTTVTEDYNCIALHKCSHSHRCIGSNYTVFC